MKKEVKKTLLVARKTMAKIKNKYLFKKRSKKIFESLFSLKKKTLNLSK